MVMRLAASSFLDMSSIRSSARRAAGALAGTLLWVGAARAQESAAPERDESVPVPDSTTPAPESKGAGADTSGPVDATAAAERTSTRLVNPVAVVAAVVPGFLVHGSGHLVAGDKRTGLRLLALEGIGLGTMAAGFVPIVLTGASRRFVGAGAALSVVGAGIFAISLLADVYGVLAPEGGTGAPPRVVPAVQVGLGYRYVYDPVFSYRNFLAYDVDYRTGRFRIDPSAWFALDDTNSRLRALGAYRFFGPLPDDEATARDGSFVDLEGAVTRHAYYAERFRSTTVELAAAGRVDLERLASSLTGSFTEMSLGWALQQYRYQVRGAPSDIADLLLARFGFGMYLGWPERPRGEVQVYYDHRHDGFAAGLKLGGIPSGVAGHFGIDAHLYVSDHWGIAAEAEAGSAYVAGFSLLFRQGDPL